MVTIPSITVPKNALAFGPGFLYYAALGTSVPASTVVGSVFTDAWPAGWNALGITREGHEFSYEFETEDITAAEYVDRLAQVTTGRSSGMSFDLMQIHATNLKRVLNGGNLATSGAGTTLRSELTPPALGAEVRCMIGWESTDLTERIYAEQAIQTGSLSVARRKGAEVATLPVSFQFEVAADGFPFHYISAGALRG